MNNWGWTCPKCQRTYAPTVHMCGTCQPRSVWSYIVTTGSSSQATSSLNLLRTLAEDKNDKKKEENNVSKDDFVKGSQGTNVFLSFGKTAAEALRSMADGLEKEKIEFVDGLSIKYEYDISEEYEYVVTAYVYPSESPVIL